MYVKVVRRNIPPDIEEDGMTIYEVRKFTSGVTYLEKQDGEFHIQLDGDEIIFGPDDPVDIYVMNNEGKTIDRYSWDAMKKISF